MVTGITEGNAAEVFASPASAPIKQDKKLNRALGKVFAVAAEGPIPLDKTLVSTLNKIGGTKAWDSAAKCGMYNAIIDHVNMEDRHVVSRAVYEDTDDLMVTKSMAARVFSDIELLDDSKRFREAAFVVGRGIAVPSEEIAQRIVNYADSLPPIEQFDALEEILPHMHPHSEIVLEKMLDAVPNEYAPKRFELAMMLYDLAETDALQERALAEALHYVDDAPAKNRTKNAVEVAFETHNAALCRQAIDVAIEHATVANKSTIKALEQALEAADAVVGSLQEDLLSEQQIMGIETALYTLTENPPKKPAPMQPVEFIARMWEMPSP